MNHTEKQPLYMNVYDRFKDLILTGRLKPGTPLPSLRKCTEELHVSRTTVENAYLQLAADGYIISKSRSGFYVTDIAAVQKQQEYLQKNSHPDSYAYDFASSGVDKESFRFDLWQRYIRSALRQTDRMLSYGEPQGEYDFRLALSDYVRKQRNILCSPEQIVIGAGVQNLLQILCPLLSDRSSVSFPTDTFRHGSTIFSDFGFHVKYRDKDCDVIYVSPAHMTSWGDVMTVKRRMELIAHASEHHHLIIEDDYENELVYMQKPTPSIFGLSAAQNVVYIGSFSRLLLPSIRISFMILPDSLKKRYQQKIACYNQTASKAEQIALCQFIRDGHLFAQTRRLKRLYEKKETALISALDQVFGTSYSIRRGSGTSLSLTLPSRNTGEKLLAQARTRSLKLRLLSEDADSITLLISYSKIPDSDFIPALQILKSLLD